MDANFHGVPLAALLIEFIFNSYRFHIRRYLIILVVAGLYMIINLAYALLYQPVYKILKWNDWFSYVLAAGSFAIALVIFIFGLIAFHCCCKEKRLAAMVEGDRSGIHERDLARISEMKQKRNTVSVEKLGSSDF